MNPHTTRAPWAWDTLSDDAHAQAWRDLDAWVGWLQRAYSPWVVLPPCWPVHEGLAAELRVYWYWHDWLMAESGSAAEAAGWHAELRRAAEDWRALAGCTHEPPIRPHARLAQERRDRHDAFVAWAARSRPAPGAAAGQLLAAGTADVPTGGNR